MEIPVQSRLSKGPVTAEEYSQLLQLRGCPNWMQVAEELFPGRLPNYLASRWMNLVGRQSTETVDRPVDGMNEAKR